MKRNILQHDNCYGCGVCTAVCPIHLIDSKLNTDGFYQPVISDIENCVECGLCLKVCSVNNSITNNAICGFATWSLDSAVRRKSSSGGTGFEIAHALVNDGYKFLGVRYNATKGRAEHYVANNISELIPSMGSKYIQSYTDEAFAKIKKGEKYVVTGTPCQIAGIRQLVKQKEMETDVLLVDFFCHGVPSLNIWKKYIKWAEKIVGPITYVSWRNKRNGWHDSWAMSIDGEETDVATIDRHGSNMLIGERKSFINIKRSEGDIFYKFFLGDMCFNKACYDKCQFKMERSMADIRLGDLWGTTYANNDLGVTGVLAFTQQGVDILKRCNIEMKSEPVSVVMEGQMTQNPQKPYYYGFLMMLLRTKLRLKTIYRVVQVLRFRTILKYKLSAS